LAADPLSLAHMKGLGSVLACSDRVQMLADGVLAQGAQGIVAMVVDCLGPDRVIRVGLYERTYDLTSRLRRTAKDDRMKAFVVIHYANVFAPAERSSPTITGETPVVPRDTDC